MVKQQPTNIAQWAIRDGLIIAFYVLAMWVTDAHFMGDAPYYVESIVKRYEGVSPDFWEFGHLYWRPFGYVLSRLLMPLTSAIVGTDLRLNVTYSLMAFNWCCGLVAALCLYRWVRNVARREWIAYLAAIAFILSNAVLNYAQSGSSYVAALGFEVLGFYFLVKDEMRSERPLRYGLLGGIALAIGVCFWFPFIWAIPAALLSPLFIYGYQRERVRLIATATIACAAVGIISYTMVILLLGISDLNGLKDWIAAASHGMKQGGIKPMIFGLPRSFIDMGNDGMIVKRYLLRDPFNPVSLFELARLSLWKLALFYGTWALLLLRTLISQSGRSLMTWLLIATLPVFAFAFIFSGGDIERYLPLWPILFFLFAHSLSTKEPKSWIKMISMAIAILFVAVLAVSNWQAMSKGRLAQTQNQTLNRISGILPRLKPESLLIVPHLEDELSNFKKSFPFHPVNRSGQVEYYALVAVQTDKVDKWRALFKEQVDKVWQGGGDVWISERLLAAKPLSEWNWVEGSDPHILWKDFPIYFSQLKLEENIGGVDGFRMLPRTPENEQALINLMRLDRVTLKEGH